MADTDTLLVHERDRVRTLTFNRPERHNALTAEMTRRLHEEIRAADARPDIGCVVIRGNGPSFSSGADLVEDIGRGDDPDYENDYERSLRDDIRMLNSGEGGYEALGNLQTPIIAQVQGYCIAGALDLATSCDLLIVAEDAQLGYPITRNIASPPTHNFTYLMGPQWTRYLLYTGDYIDGRTAAAVGLALLAVPGDELTDTVDRIAARIASVPKDLLAVHKSICGKALDAMGRPLVQRLAREADAMAHKTPVMKRFYEIGQERGFKEAYAALETD
jgi:enoyl-CoA hydratase